MQKITCSMLIPPSSPKAIRVIDENLDLLIAAVNPILGDFLTHFWNGMFSLLEVVLKPRRPMSNKCTPTEEEAVSYAYIRQAYLPDIILAYNGAITFAAEFLGPETLLQSLDLANIIADDKNTVLAEAFISTGRMEELVTSLALSSRQMLKINQGISATEKRAVKLALVQGKDRQKHKRTLAKLKRNKNVGKGKAWFGETVEIWDPNQSGLAE
jgi:hypothetical protein